MMMMQRLVAVRPLLVGVLAQPAPAMFCCCTLRPPPPTALPTGRRWLSASTQPKEAAQQGGGSPDVADIDPLQDKSIGLVQRFKKTFKQYGKVMIPVHLLTSTFWFGTFYYAAMKWVRATLFLHWTAFVFFLVFLNASNILTQLIVSGHDQIN